MTTRTAIRGVRLVDQTLADIVLDGAQIEAILPPGTAGETFSHDVACDGLVLLPPLAEPHIHLDKALTIDRAPNLSGDLTGAIDAWMRFRGELDETDVLERARAAARTAALNGATAIRTHVDTGADIGLVGTRALVRLRAELRDTIDLQIVVGHGLPVTGAGGEAGNRVLRAALEAGADAVGGAPSLDDDPVEAWRVLWSIAHEHQVPLDLHVDETLDPTAFLLGQIARDAADRSVPLTVGHIVSLSVQRGGTRRRVAQQLAAADVSVVTLPQTNLYLQGRGRGPLVPRGLTAIHDLGAAGTVIAAGADNVGDPFNPVGRIDPLETASLLVTAGHFDATAALDAVSGAARRVMGLPRWQLKPGAPADFVLVRATSLIDAIGRAPSERQVWRAGALVASTRVDVHWRADRTAPAPLTTTR